MKSIAAVDLAAWLADPARQPPMLLDVREPWEQQICLIAGSAAAPMNTLMSKVEELDPARPIVCICHHGGRSGQVAMWLSQRGFAEAYNLAGGVDAWSRQVDPQMPTY